MGRRRIEQHEVDPFGLVVDCPGRELPTLDDCAHCPHLVGAIVDVNEQVVAVRCRG